MPIVALNKPFLYLKIFQFVLGIIVYSLMFSLVWNGAACFESVAAMGITQVATVAYPFVILPVVFICSFTQGEGLEKHLMCALLSAGGFLTALTAGALTCAKCYALTRNPTAAGAICIIYSFAYLVDIGWFAYSTFFHPPE